MSGGTDALSNYFRIPRNQGTATKEQPAAPSSVRHVGTGHRAPCQAALASGRDAQRAAHLISTPCIWMFASSGPRPAQYKQNETLCLAHKGLGPMGLGPSPLCRAAKRNKTKPTKRNGSALHHGGDLHHHSAPIPPSLLQAISHPNLSPQKRQTSLLRHVPLTLIKKPHPRLNCFSYSLCNAKIEQTLQPPYGDLCARRGVGFPHAADGKRTTSHVKCHSLHCSTHANQSKLQYAWVRGIFLSARSILTC